MKNFTIYFPSSTSKSLFVTVALVLAGFCSFGQLGNNGSSNYVGGTLRINQRDNGAADGGLKIFNGTPNTNYWGLMKLNLSSTKTNICQRFLQQKRLQKRDTICMK